MGKNSKKSGLGAAVEKGKQKLKAAIKEQVKQVVKKLLIKAAPYILAGIGIILVIILLFSIFLSISDTLKSMFGNMVTGVKFFFFGRSGEVSSKELAYTKQELEKSGVDFDEIGYLGERYLIDNEVEIKIDGFTYDSYTKDSKIKAELDSKGNIKQDDKSTIVLLEYKRFLEKKIEEEEKNGIAIEGVITTNLEKSFLHSRESESKTAMKNKLKTMYDDGKVTIGKKVKFNVIAESSDPTKEADEVRCYTVTLNDSEGNFDDEEDISKETNYYVELQNIKNDAIMWYLRKDYEAQTFTFKNMNEFYLEGMFSLDKTKDYDAGGVLIQFPDDTEEQQATNAGLIGGQQYSFYTWTRGTGKPTFGILVGEDDGKFLAKIDDSDSDKNIDITDDMLDYAMPWNYPFAFHNATSAPDMSYLVSRLASVHHRLILNIYALEPRVECKFTGSYHNTEPQAKTDTTLEIVKKYQSTWYKTQSYTYKEVDGEIRKLGLVYKMKKYKITYEDDLTKPIYDSSTEPPTLEGYEQKRVETEVDTDEGYYLESGETLPTGKFDDNGSYCYEIDTSSESIDVNEIIPTLQITSQEEKLNNDGIDDMDAIVKSIPEYKNDTAEKNLKLENAEELKYYYTANEYIKGNTGAYKYKIGTDEKEERINGKTILNLPTNVRTIIDEVFNIYEQDDENNQSANQANEVKMAKEGESALTTSEKEELYRSGYDQEKDYTIAKPIVKELICYFYNLGVLDDETFRSIYLSASSALLTGTYNSWPLDQQTSEMRYDYDETTNIATMYCAADTPVLAPAAGEATVSKVGDKYVITIITGKKTVEIDGANVEVETKIIIGNVDSVKISESGNTNVTPGQEIGIASGSITYQETVGEVSQDIEQQLEETIISSNATFKWPVRDSKVYINSKYGMRTMNGETKLHAGVDMTFSGIEGTPVYASRDGRVVKVSNSITTRTGGAGWGNYVKIDHYDNTYTLYAHMGPNTIEVEEGQLVTTTTKLGEVGTTGGSTGPHLHFEIYIGGASSGNRVDPEPYLTGKSTLSDDGESAGDKTNKKTFRFTYYTPDDNDGGDLAVASSPKYTVNPSNKDPDLGCYTYNGKVVLAGAIESRVDYRESWYRRDYVHYFSFGDEVKFKYNGKEYTGIVIDLCGVSMNPEGYGHGGKNTLDVFFPSTSVGKNLGENVEVYY